jgi:hypothetical protein
MTGALAHVDDTGPNVLRTHGVVNSS